MVTMLKQQYRLVVYVDEHLHITEEKKNFFSLGKKKVLPVM